MPCDFSSEETVKEGKDGTLAHLLLPRVLAPSYFSSLVAPHGQCPHPCSPGCGCVSTRVQRGGGGNHPESLSAIRISVVYSYMEKRLIDPFAMEI